MYVNLPGHTDGQAGVIIKDKGGYAVFAGDAAVSSKNWETMKAPGYAAYSGIQNRTLEWLAKTANDPDCKAVLCSHDKDLEPKAIEI
jgi:glyoxylase-like metal-dependent hydrolase (beta-lactamase superfamily II)